MGKERILEAAIRCSDRKGFMALTRREISEEAGCSEALVSHFLGDMENARTLILEYAYKHNYLDVIAQGLSIRHPLLKNLSIDEKKAAVNSIIEG